MEKKKSKVLTVVITAVITFIVTWLLNTFVFLPAMNNGISKINTVKKMLEEYSLYEIDEQKLVDYAAIGMAASVNDPYTTYYTEEEFTAFTSDVMSSYVGIGVTIGADIEKNEITVISAVEDGPAYNAGIKSGDIIVAVDGKSYDASRMTEATMYIKSGEAGTSVTITVERDGKRFDIEVVREKIQKESVKSEMLEDDLGYLRIVSFDGKMNEEEKDTYDEFCEHMEALESSGMKKLIIDLRDNPGGDYGVVCNIVDRMVPDGIITYTEDKNGNRETEYSDEEEITIPVVILVNGGSASASEILTGAMKDYKKATVIGTQTYGKGIVQRVFPFSDGSGMSITIAKYFTPNGVCIHGIGIEPDITVPLDTEEILTELEGEEDTQLQAAIEFLSK